MKYLYAFLLLVTSHVLALAQPVVTFRSLPRNLQLFPRDAANQAVLPVEGTVTDASVQRMSLQLDRAGKLSYQQSLALSSTRTFRAAPVIRAELAEYTLRLYAHRQPGDSVLVAERTRLLCGDLFLIYGQSNAYGLDQLDEIKVNDQFMRNCSYTYGATDIPASMQWFSALQPYGGVGAFGLYMGEAIQKATQLPVAFINGAEGGASIAQLSDRNPNNPADLKTVYGRMLYRTQWAGAQQQVKALFFRQGEAEAGSSTANYAAGFDRLYQYLRQDYGSQPPLYVGQINLLSGGSPEAGALRDFQRRLALRYPNSVNSIATVGTSGYDGLHYHLNGHQQLGFEQARQVLHDLYGSGPDETVNSPNVRQVFQNSRNDTLTVVFEPIMQMRWPSDSTLTYNGQTYTRRLLNVWLANGQSGRFSAGWTEGNRVYLTLKQPETVQTLSYFPPFEGSGPQGFYDGPTLKNQRGMRAFTFDRFPVARALPAVTNLAITATTRQAITLSWAVGTSLATATVLERAVKGQSFALLTQLPAAVTTYTDTPPTRGDVYTYRVRLLGEQAESRASNVVEGQLTPCMLSVTLPATQDIAYGGTLQLTPVLSGTVAGQVITHLWRGPGGQNSTAASLTQQGLTPNLAGTYSLTVAQAGCSATAATTVRIQTLLTTEPTRTRLRLWPNPTTATQPLWTDVPEAAPGERITVRFTDMNGRVVLEQAYRKQTGPVPLSTAALQPGTYLIDVRPAVASPQASRVRID